MIDFIMQMPLQANVGWIYPKNDKGLINAYGGGKKMGDGKGRIVKKYNNKHPFNILTDETYGREDNT